MATRQYRIHFMASFDHLVSADSDAEARKIAHELKQTPWTALTVAEDFRCDYAITREDNDQ